MEESLQLINDENQDDNERTLSHTKRSSKRASICGIELQDYTPTKSMDLQSGRSPSKLKRKMIEVADAPDSDDDTDYYDSPCQELPRKSLSPLPGPRSPMRSPNKRHHNGKMMRKALPSPKMRSAKTNTSLTTPQKCFDSPLATSPPFHQSNSTSKSPTPKAYTIHSATTSPGASPVPTQLSPTAHSTTLSSPNPSSHQRQRKDFTGEENALVVSDPTEGVPTRTRVGVRVESTSTEKVEDGSETSFRTQVWNR